MKLDEMMSKFIEEVIKREKEYKKGNIRSANKYAGNIYKLSNKFMKFGKEGENALIILAHNANPYVRLWAAASAVSEFNKELAISVLTELAESTEDFGHNAQITLDFNM